MGIDELIDYLKNNSKVKIVLNRPTLANTEVRSDRIVFCTLKEDSIPTPCPEANIKVSESPPGIEQVKERLYVWEVVQGSWIKITPENATSIEAV